MRHQGSLAKLVTSVLGCVSFSAAWLCPRPLYAQNAAPHGQAFAMAGPAVFADDNAWYASGGFEYLRGNGAGIGVEAAGAWGFADGPGRPSRGPGIFNVYATGQRVDPKARIRPFVLGDVGFASPAISDTSLVILLGAGANVWLTPSKGLRVDFRVPLGLASTDGAVIAVGLVVR